MFFHPTLDEFSKEAQAKKVQIETLKMVAKNIHESGLDKLHKAFQDFASQMLPYFEETCKVSGQKDLYFSIDEDNCWRYKVIYYSDHRIKFILSYQNEDYIDLEYQDGSAYVTEKLTTDDADIDRAIKLFQSPIFMGSIAQNLLECIQ